MNVDTKKPTRWMTALFIAAALLPAALLPAQRSESPEALLQRAIQKEMVDGDLKAAIDLYKKVAETRGVSRSVAAQALLNMGRSYEHIGDAEAHKTYDRIVRDFGNQPEAAEARRRLAAFPGTGSSHTPSSSIVTTESVIGSARSVFVTPDGRFVSMRLEFSVSQPRLVIQDMSTGESELLKQEGAESAMVSPDGRQVALAYRFQGKPHELQVRNNQPNSKPVVILRTSSAFSLAAWSNDSKSILLTTSKPNSDWEIAWLSVADRTMKTVTSLEWRYMGDRPSLSPDGRYIAYSALANTPSKPVSEAPMAFRGRPSPPDSGDQSIYVVSADGSNTREVVRGASINESPMWTEDGSQVLFVSNRTGTFALYSVAIENGKERGRPFPVRGAAITERIIPVGMTKNGSYYYVKERLGGTERLFQIQVGPDGKAHGPAVHVSDDVVEGQATLGPAWSPDGTRLAFKKQVNRPIAGKSPNWVWDLVIRDENGEETPYIHNMNGGAPVWMHDGNGLLVCTATTNFEVYQLDLKTKEFTLVYSRPPTPPGSSSAALAISPDDKTIYFVEEDSIVALNLATRDRRKIWTIPTAVIPWTLSLSPDGRTLAMSAGDGPRRSTYVSRINVDGTGYAKLAPSGNPELTWTRDGRAILYIDEEKKVMSIPANGGVPELAGLALNGDFVGFAMKPDGSQIVFVSRPLSELWRVDNLSSVLNADR